MKKNIWLIPALAGTLAVAGCNSSTNHLERNSAEQRQVLDPIEDTFPVSEGFGDLLVIYENLENLEDVSPIIVEAVYTGGTELASFPESGDPEYKTALSTVRVEKVYKGDVKEGQELRIGEPGFVENGAFQTIEGYKNMDENGRYILFLYPFDMLIEGKESYVLQGAHQGKYDLNQTQKSVYVKAPKTYQEIRNEEYFGIDVDAFNTMKEQVVDKYKN